MTNKEMTMREKVEALMANEKLTTYRIAKDAGVWQNSVVTLRNGEADVGNIRFEIAEKYAAMYDELQKETTEKLSAILDVMDKEAE